MVGVDSGILQLGLEIAATWRSYEPGELLW